jgi:tetratricopeptide (TPR) repeat protein
VAELRRLVHLARAYRHMNAGDEAVTRGDVAGAIREYAAAEAMVPDSATNGEMAFWHAAMLVNAGRVEESLPLFRRAFAQDAAWRELVRRLPAAGQLPADPAMIERIATLR